MFSISGKEICKFRKHEKRMNCGYNLDLLLYLCISYIYHKTNNREYDTGSETDKLTNAKQKEQKHVNTQLET